MKRAALYALYAMLALGWAFQRGQAQGAREAATVHVGDTLQIAFSMPTADQVCLKPIGNLKLVVQQCGRTGLAFLRIYTTKGGLTLSALTADTVSLAPAPDTLAASVVAFTRYTRDASGNVTPVAADSANSGDVKCVYVVARNKAGAVLTGKPVTLGSSDTTIAILGGILPAGMACPDTTIDPARLP